MTWSILEGNVFDMLPTIAPGSIDCAVTSPPYWALRSYLPKGHALKPLELGSEPTPAAYVANMVRVFGLVRECLAVHGTLWVNVGDSYSSGGNGIGSGKQLTNVGSHIPPKRCDIDSGNLCLIPQRLAIALQDDGWIVRSVVVWRKPAPMPSSVAGWRWMRCRVKVKAGWGEKGTAPHPGTLNGGSARVPNSGGKKTAGVAEWQDCPGCKKCEPHGGYVLRHGSWRPTSSYEPILMLAKTANYFCDGEPVKTAPAEATVSRDQYTRILDDPDEQFAVAHDHETVCTGANARDVQTWAAEPLAEKHYAAYPTALVQWCLRAGTSAKGYCPMCGAPWCRILEVSGGTIGQSWHDHSDDSHRGQRGGNRGEPNSAADGWARDYKRETLGWRQSCRCIGADSVDARPAMVLDPFCGSGRTGIAAQRLGLDFIGCELNPEYVAMATRLLRDEAPLFA